MANREHGYRVVEHAISGDMARCPESDEELAIVRSVWIGRTKVRELSEGRQPVDDRADGARSCLGVLLRQEPIKPFEVCRSASRPDYLCHFGRRLGLRVPSDFAQASISACVTCRPVRS